MTPTKRNLALVDLDTGEVVYSPEDLDGFGDMIPRPKLSPPQFGPAQRQLANQARRSVRAAKPEPSHFLWLTASGDSALWSLSPADLARLFYLGSFLGYDGRLMRTPSSPLTRDQTRLVLGMKPSSFRPFMAYMVALGLVTEQADSLSIQNTVFARGRHPKKMEAFHLKVRLSTIRCLYEDLLPPADRRLGVLLSLLRFVNPKTLHLPASTKADVLRLLGNAKTTDTSRVNALLEVAYDDLSVDGVCPLLYQDADGFRFNSVLLP